MKVSGQLERAQLEDLAVVPTAGIRGRIIYDNVTGQAKLDDASVYRALLRNDGKAVVGNSGTAANNIRMHRGANGVLQFVSGADVTAEGTLSTVLNQISARLENYTDAGKPAFGNAGRMIWTTDLAIPQIDTGTAWTSISGGGGGGSLQWVEDANAPTPVEENLIQTYAYASALGQALYALVRVPDSYVTGRQIRLKSGWYSADAAGNALLQTVATLIRKNTDLITSTTNQRTSTNTAVALSGATQNIPQEIVFDLTSTSGQINGVGVSKGDFIIVNLTRGVDTATGDIKAMVYGAEVLLT